MKDIENKLKAGIGQFLKPICISRPIFINNAFFLIMKPLSDDIDSMSKDSAVTFL